MMLTQTRQQPAFTTDACGSQSIQHAGMFYKRLGSMWVLHPISDYFLAMSAQRLSKMNYPDEKLFDIEDEMCQALSLRVIVHFNDDRYRVVPDAQSAFEWALTTLESIPSESFDFFVSGVVAAMNQWVCDTQLYTLEVDLNYLDILHSTRRGASLDLQSPQARRFARCLGNLYCLLRLSKADDRKIRA